MYFIEINFNKTLISLPFNCYINEKKDIDFIKTIENIYKKITFFLLSDEIIDKINFSFKKDNKEIFSFEEKVPVNYVVKYIEQTKEDENTYEKYKLDSNFCNFINIFNKKINEIDMYNISINDKTEEIEKVFCNTEEIDLEFFLSKIYNNVNNRYYRKIANSGKMFIFKEDVIVK